MYSNIHFSVRAIREEPLCYRKFIHVQKIKKQYILKVLSLTLALDNPAMTDKNKLRYDVGLIVNGNPDIALDIRKIPDGIYAVFELPHTEQDITAFWSNIQKLVGSLSVDETKPVIERYPADKVAKHLCEFCIPLKKLS